MHCGACQAICPPRCIKLSITKDDEGKPLKNYDLDVLRCIFCGLCVESCPYEAIVLTEHYEYSAYSREPFLFNKVQLTANWEKFMSVDKTEYYFKHFWSPKSEDFTEHDNQAVFDKVRFEQKRAAGSLFK
jgi:NADH-quinone oxidoreductase subunit I